MNKSVNTNITYQPDPPHTSPMSPAQPLMHGMCWGQLQLHGCSHLPSHLSMASAWPFTAQSNARSRPPYGEAFELEDDRHSVGML